MKATNFNAKIDSRENFLFYLNIFIVSALYLAFPLLLTVIFLTSASAPIVIFAALAVLSVCYLFLMKKCLPKNVENRLSNLNFWFFSIPILVGFGLGLLISFGSFGVTFPLS